MTMAAAVRASSICVSSVEVTAPPFGLACRRVFQRDRGLGGYRAEDTFPSSGVHPDLRLSTQVKVLVTRNMEHGDRQQELRAVRDRVHAAAGARALLLGPLPGRVEPAERQRPSGRGRRAGLDD